MARNKRRQVNQRDNGGVGETEERRRSEENSRFAQVMLCLYCDVLLITSGEMQRKSRRMHGERQVEEKSQDRERENTLIHKHPSVLERAHSLPFTRTHTAVMLHWSEKHPSGFAS